MTLAVVRARSKPTYQSVDDIEEEEFIGTYVTGYGFAVATDQPAYLLSGGVSEWFSKRKARLGINSGLYLSSWFASQFI